MKLIALSVLSLACVSSWAAPVNQVAYGSLTGTEIVDFDDIAGGPAPGTNYDSVFVSHGVTFGERFVGQTLTAAGNFDQLGGSPSAPLTLMAGAAGQNLNVFLNGSSNVLTGLGSLGFPSFDAIGEGSIALTFSSDQSEFGFQLVGGNLGNAHIDFFRANGSLVDSLTVSGLTDSFYGFSRDAGVKDIRGISIWNDDAGGIGFDNLKHDVISVVPTIPEPSTYSLLLAGVAALGALARRRRVR